MSTASSLRSLLSRTDGTAPAIQSAAGAMMKHYDKSASVAVVEWRNALNQARADQHLPLLYVANEVLQNSKRNRGNKFLEAFSPILGQSLIHICQNNPAVIEKVRRTVKIWGDRRVFSVRYVNEMLQGMEPFRNGGSAPAPVRRSSSTSSHNSPASQPPSTSPKPQQPSDAISSPKDAPMEDAAESDNDDDDDDGDLFGDANDRLLDVELDLDKAAASAKGTNNQNPTTARKRRRGSNKSSSPNKIQRRRSILSTNSLMDLWNQVSGLQDSYEHCQRMVSSIDSAYLDESSALEQIDTLVGDELLQQYKQTLLYEKRVVEQREELHNIAQQRRALELEAIRYLPWLEGALKQDLDDFAFCNKLEKQVEAVKKVHALAKVARNVRLEEEAKRQKQREERERKKAEEEERKKFMEAATAKVTVAQPGMVWNKATGEYQYLHTDESWRD